MSTQYRMVLEGELRLEVNVAHQSSGESDIDGVFELRGDLKTTQKTPEDFTPVRERPTMQQEGLFEPGWLEEEFEQARRDVAMWPEWKRRLVGLDHTPGPVDMKHAPPDRGRTNDEPTASNNE